MNKIEVVVAGHSCIDIIPEFYSGGEKLSDILSPGKLVNIGPLLTATGGVVPNTGGALQKLGINTAFAGKVGNIKKIFHALTGEKKVRRKFFSDLKMD